MTWTEFLAHSEGTDARYFAALCLLVITDIVFAETFHVVNVHAHLMAESVRHEKCTYTIHHRIVGVALDKSEFFQSVKQCGDCCYMVVDVDFAWLNAFDTFHVGCEHCLVDIFLP